MKLSTKPRIISVHFVSEKIRTILFASIIMCTWAYGANASQFDYNIEVLTGSTMAVYQGFAGRNAVHLALLSGLPNDVTLSISGLPLGATAAFDYTNVCQFDREFGAPPFQSTLGFKVVTSENTPLGTYRIKVAGSGSGIIRSASFNLMVEAVPNSGRLHYVSVTGNDGNSGSRLSPFKTIQKAANLVQPGDVVIVEPGLYRERVRVKNSGLSDKQIMFLGKDGAILDGGTVVKGWTRDDSVYPGAYKKPLSEIAFEPMYMAWNNKFVLVWEVYDDSTSSGQYMRALMNSELSADASSELYSFAGAYGVTLGNDFYVKFRDNRSPDNEDFTLSPLEAAFEIDGHCHNTISGFTIRNAFRNVSLQNGACFNTISNNYVRGGSYGIDINSGSHNNIVKNNDMTLDHYYGDFGHSLYRGKYFPADRASAPLFTHLRHAARWVQNRTPLIRTTLQI